MTDAIRNGKWLKTTKQKGSKMKNIDGDGKQLTVGAKVVFKNKVYHTPYSPFYDDYRGHTFKVVKFHYEKTHVELKCIDAPKIKVNGYVHPDEVKVIC